MIRFRHAPPRAAKGASGGQAGVAARATERRWPVLTTRCSNNYGPYPFPEKLIPLFLTILSGSTGGR